MEISKGQAIAAVVVLLAAFMFFNPSNPLDTGMNQMNQLNQYNNLNGNSVDRLGQNSNAETGNNLNQQPIVVTSEYIPFQLSNVYLYVMDQLNTKNGIQNAEVEVLNVPDGAYTVDDLYAIASDPNRYVIDEDTATDSNGKAAFSAGKIRSTVDYLYAIRGSASTVYDKVFVAAVPKIPDTKTDYSFPEQVFAYKVGSFDDIVASGASNSGFKAGTFNATTNTGSLDATSLSGLQYAYFDITIGCNTTGKSLESPVLQMHYTEGKDFPSGAITSVYITKRTGSDYGFEGIDYADYIDTEYPIELNGDLDWNADEQKYYMTIAHSGVYRVKITWDASIAESGDELKICLDDQGDYLAKSKVTRNTLASAECFTLTTV